MRAACRATGTALYEVIGRVELSLQYKQHILVALLDIKGAFNNVITNAIKEVLIRIRLKAYLTLWIISKLRTRTIQSNLTRTLNSGTPLGGPIINVNYLGT